MAKHFKPCDGYRSFPTASRRSVAHHDFAAIQSVSASFYRRGYMFEEDGSNNEKLGWLEGKSPAKYGLVCKYVRDMAHVIAGCRRVLHDEGKLVFVLADNKMEGRTVPVVNIVMELLVVLNFQSVTSVRRRIKTGRR